MIMRALLVAAAITPVLVWISETSTGILRLLATLLTALAVMVGIAVALAIALSRMEGGRRTHPAPSQTTTPRAGRAGTR